MTHTQKERCRRIIHSYAILAGVGNAIPVPAVDILVDMAVLSALTMRLGDVFEANISREFAKNLVIVLIKRQLAVRITKAVIKHIPLAGWLAGPVMGVLMTESAGWELAARLDRKGVQE
ncbi:MAG: hypothetical protein LBC67_01580 [Spirochaetales bacterium]|jgi:uncharacterized protein (DUF697 family)|nr:hypothetical protein [Spirochaetales bacterium]